MSDLTSDVVVDVPLYAQSEVHQRRWILLAVLCLSLVMVVMAVSSLNVALPTLQRDLGASATMLQWIVDAYALVFAGLLLTAGALGDRFGRKGALLVGLAVFGVGVHDQRRWPSSATIVIVGAGGAGSGRGVRDAGHAVADHRHLPAGGAAAGHRGVGRVRRRRRSHRRRS